MPKIVADADKAETRTVSLPGSMWEKVDAAKGGRSVYLKRLVERDLESKKDDPNSLRDILVDLTRRICGEVDAREMEQAIGTASQPHALKTILSLGLQKLRSEKMEVQEPAPSLSPTQNLVDPVAAAQRSAKKLKEVPIRPKHTSESPHQNERTTLRPGANKEDDPATP